MKKKSAAIITTTIVTAFIALEQSVAAPPITYVVKITNGSSMPISPIVTYIREGANAESELGKFATPGFIKLCQMGDAGSRSTELRKDPLNSSVAQTATPLLPGASVSTEVIVQDPRKQSLHVETMYGKTNDVCGIASVGSHALEGLKSHVATANISHDRTVVTGAFEDARFEGGYLNSGECQQVKDAVSCLREISVAMDKPTPIRAFNGYISSVEMGLEEKFGTTDTMGTRLPTSGGLQIEVKLKH